MHHTTTLVVDFDDTLAITLNRDWENAVPNQALIDKLNHLFDQGWTINIVTARGQISCNGDSEAADKKYRAQIEKWLADHKVYYHSLSFQKKLAAYYIDDKGITPEDFLIKFERVDLKGGMSGAKVVYDKAANAVYKTATNTHSAVAWYKAAEKKFNVPKIYSVIGDTIKMEVLHPYTGDFKNILNTCLAFSECAPLHPGLLPIKYVDRCVHRLRQQLKEDELDFKMLENVIEYAVHGSPISFSHGDFSISNIMSDETGSNVFLIDPINDPTLLSSWVVDLGKLYMSIALEFGDSDTRLDEIEKFVLEHGKCVTVDALRAHELGHLCRVFPYADAFKRVEILNRIKAKLQVFKDMVHQSNINHLQAINHVSK